MDGPDTLSGRISGIRWKISRIAGYHFGKITKVIGKYAEIFIVRFLLILNFLKNYLIKFNKILINFSKLCVI